MKEIRQNKYEWGLSELIWMKSKTININKVPEKTREKINVREF